MGTLVIGGRQLPCATWQDVPSPGGEPVATFRDRSPFAPAGRAHVAVADLPRPPRPRPRGRCHPDTA